MCCHADAAANTLCTLMPPPQILILSMKFKTFHTWDISRRSRAYALVMPWMICISWLLIISLVFGLYRRLFRLKASLVSYLNTKWRSGTLPNIIDAMLDIDRDISMNIIAMLGLGMHDADDLFIVLQLYSQMFPNNIERWSYPSRNKNNIHYFRECIPFPRNIYIHIDEL